VRVAGVDLGQRRIGVAVSDRAGMLASPWCTLERSGDDEADRAAVVAAVLEAGAERVVVGLPVSLDGRHGHAARAARAEAAALAELLDPHGIEVEMFDERFTTVIAERQLAAAGHRRRARRAVVDQAAATVLLQAWLDRYRTTADD